MRLYNIFQHYENYSFEELRLASPSTKGDSEKLTMESQGNGTYTVYWTPMATGYYDISVEVDGYPLTKQVFYILLHLTTYFIIAYLYNLIY